MKKEEIILVGGGGHCRSCIDVVEQQDRYAIAGIVDLPESAGEKVLGYPVLAGDADLPRLAEAYPHFLITLGQIKNPVRRTELFTLLKRLGASLPAIVSARAYVSRHAVVGEGSIVMHNAVINAGARVGRNCIINTCALVEHDAVIEDFCHISTATVINGATRVAEGSFVGSNSVTRENLVIGERSVVGCGVSVTANIRPGTVFTGEK